MFMDKNVYIAISRKNVYNIIIIVVVLNNMQFNIINDRFIYLYILHKTDQYGKL